MPRARKTNDASLSARRKLVGTDKMYGRSRLAIELLGAELVVDDVGVIGLRQRTLRVDAMRSEAKDIRLKRGLERDSVAVGGEHRREPGIAIVKIARHTERPAFVGAHRCGEQQHKDGDESVAATHAVNVASRLFVRQHISNGSGKTENAGCHKNAIHYGVKNAFRKNRTFSLTPHAVPYMFLYSGEIGQRSKRSPRRPPISPSFICLLCP
jgi:hypothetical protein